LHHSADSHNLFSIHFIADFLQCGLFHGQLPWLLIVRHIIILPHSPAATFNSDRLFNSTRRGLLNWNVVVMAVVDNFLPAPDSVRVALDLTQMSHLDIPPPGDSVAKRSISHPAGFIEIAGEITHTE
jgi:hypothetical protein